MTHEEFKDKFNNLDYNYFNNHISYIDLLVDIHNFLFEDEPHAGILRCSDYHKEKINLIIKDLLEIDFDENIYEVSKKLCQGVSTIWLYQPFYDGNTKTSLTLLKFIILSKDRDFNYKIPDEENDKYKKLVPLIYSKNSKVPNKSIRLIKKNIQYKRSS